MDNLPAHSPLGASSAERWMNCPGSVALIDALRGSGQYEEDDPDYRRDGTQAHALAAHCLQSGIGAGEALLEAEWDALDMEMVNAVQVYLDYVRVLPGDHYCEVKVHRPELHPLFYGTMDFASVARITDWAEFVDYKHGAGVIVEAGKAVGDNPQLSYYAYGMIAEKFDDYPDDMPIKLTICQPRAAHADGSTRSMETTAGEIRQWAHDTLRPAMDRAMHERYLSMGEWCRFCPAKIVCPAMRGLMKQTIELKAEALSDETLSTAYQQVDAIKMVIKAIEEEVKRRMIEQQRELPGLKVVLGRVNRIWKDGAEKALQAAFGAAAYSDPKLKSPKMIEDAFGTHGKEAAAEFGFKPRGGYTIALSGDSRAAAKIETVEDRNAGFLAHIKEAAE